MLAAPGLTFRAARFRAWNLAVLALGVAASLSSGAWVLDALRGPWAAVLAVAVAALVAAVSLSLLRRQPILLRWDGQVWAWGPPRVSAEAWPRGRVQVCMDLQGWLLLRLHPEAGGQQTAATWLPVERQGDAALWHALRCAVYSPTPVADDVTARETA